MAVYIDERWSVAARWCRRLAVFSVLLGVVAIAAHWFSLIETWPFLVVLAVVAGLAGLSLVFAVAGFQRVWYFGDRGGRDIFYGVLVALLALTPYALTAWVAYRSPALSQASTDLADPPKVTRRVVGLPPVPPLGNAEIALHQEAYPELTGRRYAAPIDQVLLAVETLLTQRGWVADDVSPTTDDVEFVIGAVAYIPVLAIPYDVAIRLTDEGDATYVDMRSVARYGARDLGVDAWIIEGFLGDLDKQAGTLAGVAGSEE